MLDFGAMHDLYGPPRDELAALAPGLVLRSIGLGEICQAWGGLLVRSSDRSGSAALDLARRQPGVARHLPSHRSVLGRGRLQDADGRLRPARARAAAARRLRSIVDAGRHRGGARARIWGGRCSRGAGASAASGRIGPDAGHRRRPGRRDHPGPTGSARAMASPPTLRAEAEARDGERESVEGAAP